MTDLSKDTSNCCEAPPIPETDMCSQCNEYAEFNQTIDARFLNVEDFAEMWRAMK